MLHDASAAESATGQPSAFVEDRVVKDVLQTGHPLLAAGISHLEKVVPGQLRGGLAAPRDVAPDVEGADGGGGIRDHVHGLRDVVSPDADVTPAPFDLEASSQQSRKTFP